MKRRVAVSLAAIIILFAALLPLYYVFSYGKNDALQQAIQGGNRTEGGGGYNAPLSYGNNYLESLVFGVVGILVVFAAFYIILLLIKRRKWKSDE